MPATPRTAVQPTQAASSSSSSAPRVVQAVTEPVATVQRAQREPIIVVYDDRTQLERHLDATGHVSSDPGRQLAVTMRKRRLDDVDETQGKERKTLSATLSKDTELQKAVNEYDAFVCFMAERIPTGAKTIQPKYGKTKALGNEASYFATTR